MERRIGFLHNWGVVMAALLCLACNKEKTDPVMKSQGQSSGEEVEVRLNASILEEDLADSNNPGRNTKAIVDPDETADIRNIWIMQYDGTSTESLLMGHPSYLEADDFTVSGNRISAKIKLLSTPSPTTVFFLANTYDKSLYVPRTLGEMVSSGIIASKESELLEYDGTDHHILFSGWKELESVGKETSFSAELSRNISKVVLRVVNSSHNASPEITVNDVRLESIPTTSYYFPSYGNPDVFPATGSFSVRSSDVKVWPADKPQGNEEVSEDFVFYVPVNKRGTAVNTDESAKNKYAPKDATSAVISCSYMDEDGSAVSLSYRVFLGKNLKNDFNLENNKTYTLTVTIKSKGNANIDSRITDYGPVDFTPSSVGRANCYILNPPASEGYWRTFSIPVDRVDTFWGKGYTEQTAPYEYEPNYVLSPSNDWIAEVVWSDFTINRENNFRFVGGGLTYEGKGLEPVKVQIPKGVSGNVVISIKRKDLSQSPILWSWHLWITDYAPDDAIKFQIPSTTVFDYSVSGGMVHRLDGTTWTNSLYLSSFMMDRNCGALSNTMPESASTPGVLYYQHGRKDPLYCPNGSPMGKINNNDPNVAGTAENPTKAVQYSVHNPTVFINGTGSDSETKYNWTRSNKYNPTKEEKGSASYKGNIWNDPYATGLKATDYDGNHKKSIFDPCPPGWRAPEDWIYSSLAASNFPWTDRGRLYGGTNFFPAVGNINYSGNVAGFGTSGYYVSSSDNKDYTWASWRMNFDASSVSHANNQKVMGWTVRCINKNE